MEIVIKPEEKYWSELLKRPEADASSLEKSVRKILQQVKLKGDAAVRKYSFQFDGVRLKNMEVSRKEVEVSATLLSDDLKEAIEVAAKNIRLFHEKQLSEEL